MKTDRQLSQDLRPILSAISELAAKGANAADCNECCEHDFDDRPCPVQYLHRIARELTRTPLSYDVGAIIGSED